MDIYAILNGGYSEYSEITTAVNTEDKKGGKAQVSVTGGFKLFNFGGTMSGEAAKTDTKADEKKEKRVQTVTSALGIVKSVLAEKGYLAEDILTTKPGQFVCLPVTLSINSIKSLLNEMRELLKLTESMKKMGAAVETASKNSADIDNILKMIQVFFDGEEIIFETKDYAVVGNIVDKNLYQAERTDIIGTELKCLAQVKRIYPNGTELMKNTMFTKIKDHAAKMKLIESVAKINDNNVFDFETVAVPSIYDKPVYQLEIIALYQ